MSFQLLVARLGNAPILPINLIAINITWPTNIQTVANGDFWTLISIHIPVSVPSVPPLALILNSIPGETESTLEPPKRDSLTWFNVTASISTHTFYYVVEFLADCATNMVARTRNHNMKQTRHS